MNKIKELGQVMTPTSLISYMIDLLHLREEDIKQKTYIDNSCGDGGFIRELLSRGVPPEHIYACDIDPEIIQPVLQMLPNQNVYIGSAFDKTDWYKKFDYVIGNPPYVRIHNISPALKALLQKDYSFCVGMYDLYLAFFELGMRFVKPEGILLYITPNGYCKNQNGEKFRQYIERHNALVYFEDFENTNQFPDYSTYSCITMLKRDGGTHTYPWNNQHQKIGLHYSSIQNGLATLADKIFIADNFSFLEPDFIHPAYKASTGEYKQLIVPPKNEEDLAACPKTYEYLLSHKEKLERRSLTASTQWFHLGRSQGLTFIDQEKIAISTIVPYEGIKIQQLPAGCYVYSGLYATAKDLSLLEQELRSPNLLQFLLERGKAMSGNYRQITSTLLKQY